MSALSSIFHGGAVVVRVAVFTIATWVGAVLAGYTYHWLAGTIDIIPFFAAGAGCLAGILAGGIGLLVLAVFPFGKVWATSDISIYRQLFEKLVVLYVGLLIVGGGLVTYICKLHFDKNSDSSLGHFQSAILNYC